MGSKRDTEKHMGDTENLLMVSLPLPRGSSGVCQFKAERFGPSRLTETDKCLQEAGAEACVALSASQDEESGFDLVLVLSQEEPSSR